MDYEEGIKVQFATKGEDATTKGQDVEIKADETEDFEKGVSYELELKEEQAENDNPFEMNESSSDHSRT
jgi:hypothetical protein